MAEKLKKYYFVILGSAATAFGLDLFLVPAKIAPGGISGLSTVIHYLTGIPVGVLILFINIPIFILGAVNFSRQFMLSSLFGTLALSLLTEFFSFLKPITSDVILSSVFGGAFMGIGIGLVFRAGTTTGGTDIIVKLLKNKYKDFSTGNFVMLVDAVIVLFAGAVFKTWETVLYSSISLLVSSYIIDMIVEGINYAKAVFIISENPKLIADEISSALSRGTTLLCGFSTYTGKEKNTLLCVVKRYEISRLKDIIYNADRSAFVIVSDAKEVLGNGFD